MSTHTTQFTSLGERLFSLTPPALSETHAIRNDLKTHATKEEIVRRVANRSYGQDRECVEYSTDAHELMEALGLSQSEIVQMINISGKWDKKRKVYKTLDKSLNLELRHRGYAGDDIPKLIQIHRTKKEIERKKATIIVREETEKALEVLSQSDIV